MKLDYICDQLAASLLKPGDLVECMDNKEIYGTNIEEGEIFEVISQEHGPFGNMLTTIKKDSKIVNYRFFPRRFRKIEK